MPVDVQRLKEIFAEAIALRSGEARTAYLDRACAEDNDLRREVESYLAAAENTEALMGATLVGNVPLVEQPGQRIGRYKLLQQIGEGGFGVVFMAEQEYPVRRNVALKVIKLGMDTRQVVARFEAERQALAMLDHPNIAKVLDGGATETGRPYFVMELVRGIPITQYCDGERLDIRQRLELFVQVCGAVQHAHQKGLIHRDLKPSNVLVSTQDGQAHAKVIDFGIAKATQARLTEKTLFTEFHHLIGTPEYMSPEQAGGGLDIDTRSDVYSLGVLLYELLTGTTPFDGRDLRSKAYAEIQRIIREVDPPKPSTRLSTMKDGVANVAAQRGNVDVEKLGASVRGEPDWIVMKCLDKDRTRRYDSASGLAADIRHHLDDEPISAGAPSRAHRVRKFVRRNKVPVIASALVVLTLTGGVIGTTIGLLRESRQRTRAQQNEREAKSQAARAEAVARFQTDMLGSADPDRLLGERVTVLQAIRAAAAELDAGKLSDQPLVEASVRDMIGSTLLALGQMDEADPNLRRALDLRRAHLPAEHLDVAWSIATLAPIYLDRGQHAMNEQMLREALAIRRKLLPPNSAAIARTLDNLSDNLVSQHRLAEAEAVAREEVAICAQLPPDDPESSIGVGRLAAALWHQGKFAEAETLYRQQLAMRRKQYPPGHSRIAESLVMLSSTLRSMQKFDELEAMAREAIEINRKALPAGHSHQAMSLTMLGLALEPQGKLAEAEQCYRESLAIDRKALPAGHSRIGMSLSNLGLVLMRQNKFDESEALLRELLELRRNSPVQNPTLTASAILNLGGLMHQSGRLVEAEQNFREALRMFQANLPPDHPQTTDTLVTLASNLIKQGKPDEANALLATTRPTTAGATTRP